VIQTRQAVMSFLQQAIHERVSLAQAQAQLLQVAQLIEQTRQRLSGSAARPAAVAAGPVRAVKA